MNNGLINRQASKAVNRIFLLNSIFSMGDSAFKPAARTKTTNHEYRQMPGKTVCLSFGTGKGE